MGNVVSKKKTMLNTKRLFQALETGNTERVAKLLPISDPLARDRYGWTALMHTAWEGHRETVQLLLPVSDPLVQDRDGLTALMWASSNGHTEIVQLLLPGSEIEVQDYKGRSAADMAFKYGHESTAGLIKAYVLCKAEAGELSEAIPERAGDDAMARRSRSL